MESLVTVRSVIEALLLCLLFFVVHRCLTWMFRGSSKKLPPGPREWGTSWKVLKASWNGNLSVLASEWAREFGDLTFVNSLGQPLLFLNSAEVTRKLLGSDQCKLLVAERPQGAASRITSYNGKDLVFSKFDAIMRKKRRLFHTVIGLYGDGVEKFENVVWGEMERMFSEVDKSEGDDVDITKELVPSLKIIIYILAIGQAPTDPTIPDILEEYDRATNNLVRPAVDFVLNYLPFMAYIPGTLKNMVDETLAAKKKADELLYFGPKQTYVRGQPRGMTDLLLDHQKKPGYEWLENDEEHILAFLASIFVSAHLTSSAMLTSTFLCLLNYPKVTEKIREEVDRVIGDQRPKIEHKSSMPYTEATLLEALRILPPTPLCGFRKANQDLDFEGMFIPKDTLIIINSWYYLHDENVWEDPWSFKPERFLDSQGQLLPPDHQRRKDLLSFGAGARACPGEVFARSRVFLILTSVLQRYNILPPANENLTPTDFRVYNEGIQGAVRQVRPYGCRLIHRKRT